MIIGTGTDLANIDRINKVLLRFGDRFRNRVFTKSEQTKAKKRKDEAGTLAKRWAAKEACSKALGTGLRMGISCLLYTSPSPRDRTRSRMPSSA